MEATSRSSAEALGRFRLFYLSLAAHLHGWVWCLSSSFHLLRWPAVIDAANGIFLPILAFNEALLVFQLQRKKRQRREKSATRRSFRGASWRTWLGFSQRTWTSSGKKLSVWKGGIFPHLISWNTTLELIYFNVSLLINRTFTVFLLWTIKSTKKN